jgi:hypothetical protein
VKYKTTKCDTAAKYEHYARRKDFWGPLVCCSQQTKGRKMHPSSKEITARQTRKASSE